MYGLADSVIAIATAINSETTGRPRRERRGKATGPKDDRALRQSRLPAPRAQATPATRLTRSCSPARAGSAVRGEVYTATSGRTLFSLPRSTRIRAFPVLHDPVP